MTTSRDPGNRKPPAGGTEGISEQNDVAGSQYIDHTAIVELTEAAEAQYSAQILNATTLDRARGLLRSVPGEAFDSPVHRWIREVATQCVDSLILPCPLTVVDIARRDGIPLPPAFSFAPVAALNAIAADSLPAVLDDYIAGMVRSNHVRRAAERAGALVKAAAWAGDLDQLGQMIRLQLGAVLGLVEAEGAIG